MITFLGGYISSKVTYLILLPFLFFGCISDNVFSGPTTSVQGFAWESSLPKVIAFVSSSSSDSVNIMEYDVTGTEIKKASFRKVYFSRYSQHYNIHFLPDNQHAAYYQYGDDIVLINTDSGSIQTLASKSDLADVSPSGELFFQSDPAIDPPLYSLCVRQGNTFNILRTVDFFNGSEGSSSPFFLTESIVGATKSPLIVPGDVCSTAFFDTTGNEIMTVDDCLKDCSFAPVSHALACIGSSDILTLIDLEAKTKRELKSLPKTGSIVFAPKGDVVYYTTFNTKDAQGELSSIDIISGVITKLASDVNGSIALSPDKTRLAYFTYVDNNLKFRTIKVK
jgi:hypothetical protein